MLVKARLSLHVLNTIEQTTSKFLLFSVVARIRFNQVASEGKYLDLSMESSSVPFPVVAWGWLGPQGK